MTMQHHDHPDDERLAALAGGDSEVAGDTALREHVSACDRCGPLVDELALLRTALADLPDLVPSRSIQLIPPVPSADTSRGPLSWLRTLAGPVMTAGAGLALVGAVGLGGLAVSGMATGGGAAPQGADTDSGRNAAENDSLQPTPRGPAYAAGQTLGAVATPRAEDKTPGAVATPRVEDQSPADEQSRSFAEPFLLTDTSTPFPWLALLLAGLTLLIGGLVLRFSIRPRTG